MSNIQHSPPTIALPALAISSCKLSKNTAGNDLTSDDVSAQKKSYQRGCHQNRRRPANNRLCHYGQKIPARLVLYFLSWSGFLVSFMMRNDMNFAIVVMTHDNVQPSVNLTSTAYSNCTPVLQSLPIMGVDDLSHQFVRTEINATADKFDGPMAVQNYSSSISKGAVPNSNDDCWMHSGESNSSLNTDNRYNWSATCKSVILSSFYWCYVLSQVVGGIATQRYGTKQVFGWSQFVTAACSLCIPISADLHYTAVILLRSIQGFASGLTWPAMYAIVGHWIPLSERSRFMSSFQGFSIGIGLTYPLCGFIIKYSWRYIFFTTGTLGILWCLAWYFLAFNTPREHPRISTQELDYIERSVAVSTCQSHSVPWRQIVSSRATWGIAVATFGRIWIHYIFIIYGPNFMKNMLEFDYAANGFLSGMPFICSYMSSVVFCYVADQLILSERISLTNVRKIFTALSQIIPGGLMYWIGYMEGNIVMLLILWFVAVTFITASYAGAMANIVDIAPNLAGPVLAFCQTIHMSASFLSPLVSGLLLTDEHSIEQWRTVFGVATMVTVSTYIFYHVLGTAEVQSWNYPSLALLSVSTDGSDSGTGQKGNYAQEPREHRVSPESVNLIKDDKSLCPLTQHTKNNSALHIP